MTYAILFVVHDDFLQGDEGAGFARSGTVNLTEGEKSGVSSIDRGGGAKLVGLRSHTQMCPRPACPESHSRKCASSPGSWIAVAYGSGQRIVGMGHLPVCLPVGPWCRGDDVRVGRCWRFGVARVRRRMGRLEGGLDLPSPLEGRQWNSGNRSRWRIVEKFETKPRQSSRLGREERGCWEKEEG